MGEREDAARRYSRRRFLTSLGLAAGGLLAAPLVGAKGASAAPTHTAPGDGAKSPAKSAVRLKVGVLLPQSSIYPQLGANFMAGMRTCLRASGYDRLPREISLVPEEVSPGQSLQKATALLQANKANLLAGVFAPNVAAQLQGVLKANQALLLASSLGENIPRYSEQSQDIFYHTLGYWQANYALGNWAVKNLGRKVFVATSFYDSGYDALYAFRLGVASAGGEVVGTHITNMSGGSEDIGPVMDAINAAKPDVVYGGYCGQHAIDFVKAYGNSGLAWRTPLVGSAFLVDESVLPSQGSSALGIHTCLPWAPSIENQENRNFIAAYRQLTGQAPDAFALLGFEAARLIIQAVETAGGYAGKSDSLRASMAAARFDGPRGPVAMDVQGQGSGGTFYLRQVKREGTALQNALVSELNVDAERDELVGALRASVKTGWLNAYRSM